MNAFDALVDDALALFWRLEPVTASFAGETSFDALLPSVTSSARAAENAAFEDLGARLDALTIPDDAGARIDAAYVRAFVAQRRVESRVRPRTHNPAWYTGEAAFSVISLLFRADADGLERALHARIAELPDFFAAGRAELAGIPVPRPWAERAALEAAALERLLTIGFAAHPWAARCDRSVVDRTVAAARRFASDLRDREDTPIACGRDHLAFLMTHVHGMSETPEELERRAASAYDEALDELASIARAIEPSATWRDVLARSADARPAPGAVLETLQTWHERALAAALPLMTPAAEYDLTFEALPSWARPVAGDLYFLFYRSPAARSPGRGSTYWSSGVPSLSDAKLIHAVHHGSIGHHTQNARARAARSRFARIAGTDGASALAFLSAGSLVEGWACYAEDLLAEAPDFYSPDEHVLLAYFRLRNIACCLVDVRLHAGDWSLAEAQRFYRDDVAFAPARVVAETVRNSIFPASRLMYWTGTTLISELRGRSALSARAFHDRLLSFGAAPVPWIARELAS